MAIAALQLGAAPASAHISKPTANAACDITAIFTWHGYSTATLAKVTMIDEQSHFKVVATQTATASGTLTAVVPAEPGAKQTIKVVGDLYNGTGGKLTQAGSSAKLSCIFG